MSRQTEYTGKFEKQPGQGSGKRASALVILLLTVLVLFARFGSEAFKVMAYYDVFLGGKGLLNYGEVSEVNLKSSLNSRGKTIEIYENVPEDGLGENQILKLDNGTTLVYNGHTYKLNQDLVTILVLGIDQEIEDETVRGGTGGQSDLILLVGLDTRTGNANVLNISRETYAEIEAYTQDGAYIETRFAQITTAYGYGDGRELSCANTMRAVSRLLYGLPISSYVSIDMAGIRAANEAVGGVTLKSLTDVQMPDGTSVHEGDMIELHEANLERYLRTREKDMTGNAGRMERHKQFFTEFAKKAISITKSDLTFPVTLFSALSPYMVTDLDIPDVTFLSSCFAENGSHFAFLTIDGTYDMLGENAVYYPDDLDLFEAVLQVFYLRVD